MVIEVVTFNNYAKVRIYSNIFEGSIIEYRISNLIEYRTLSNLWDIRSIEPSNIEPSNLIEYRTLSKPRDIRSIEPSNIEYRTLDRTVR